MLVYVVGGYEEAVEDVGDGDRGAELLEFDGDGCVRDPVDEGFGRERSGGWSLSFGDFVVGKGGKLMIGCWIVLG